MVHCWKCFTLVFFFLLNLSVLISMCVQGFKRLRTAVWEQQQEDHSCSPHQVVLSDPKRSAGHQFARLLWTENCMIFFNKSQHTLFSSYPYVHKASPRPFNSQHMFWCWKDVLKKEWKEWFWMFCSSDVSDGTRSLRWPGKWRSLSGRGSLISQWRNLPVWAISWATDLPLFPDSFSCEHEVTRM